LSVKDDRRLDDDVPDGPWVERARSGDPAAQGALVRRHHGAAYAVALSVTRDQDTAQDVVQDAFVKAFGALDGFRGDASFKTWLLSITVNEARGALRKRTRRREVGLEGAPPVAAGGPDPAEAAVMAEEAARARSMLERLPEKQRMSVSLRIDQGLSFREIGEVIGSSEGAARVNYFHGIRRLRELME
jgi:RNA polymerase sigma-70 factor (ECF subfamily)